MLEKMNETESVARSVQYLRVVDGHPNSHDPWAEVPVTVANRICRGVVFFLCAGDFKADQVKVMETKSLAEFAKEL